MSGGDQHGDAPVRQPGGAVLGQGVVLVADVVLVPGQRGPGVSLDPAVAAGAGAVVVVVEAMPGGLTGL